MEARERAAAEGNARAEDVIAIYRKRTHIDTSGAERATQARYFVVDGVEALAKFGNDAWDRVVAVLTTGQAWQFKPYKWSDPRTLFHHGEWILSTSIQLCYASAIRLSITLSITAILILMAGGNFNHPRTSSERDDAFPIIKSNLFQSILLTRRFFLPVKGFHVSWANDPPNTKIKDWNVTDLKVSAQNCLLHNNSHFSTSIPSFLALTDHPHNAEPSPPYFLFVSTWTQRK